MTVKLVKFWAVWCGPCRGYDPIVKSVVKALKLEYDEVNIDDDANTSAVYGIRAIPTIKLFQNHEEIGTLVGAVSESQLLAWVKDKLDDITQSGERH